MSELFPTPRAEAPLMLRPEAFIGAASPLWAYFTGAAMTGVAWWWMTHWMRPAELGALAEAAAQPVLEAVAAATLIEAAEAAELEAMAEALMEPVVEALAEAAGGPLAEALAGEEIPALPVGGEAAPFGAAVLEAELISDPDLAAELSPELSSEPAPAPRPPPRPRKPREGQPKPH
jgi:hypothetical protein